MNRNLILLLALAILCRCSTRKAENKTGALANISIKYAEGFTVEEFPGYKLVNIVKPYQGAKSGYQYLLVQRGATVPEHSAETKVITIPLESIVCTSTTHIPLLDFLGETSKLIGFPTTDYISSEKMRARIDLGKVLDLGIDKGMNVELLATLHPSVVMAYAMSSDLGQLKKVQTMGIPVIINAEYLERHPLGRAEWIKFMALFFNKEHQADSVFQIIESEYLSTQELAARAAAKPTVMSGIVYGDTWFLPGGKNYAARLLDDAGLKYLWASDTTHGFQELSFESVFAKAKDADLWIGVGSFKTLEEIKNAEARYALFKPWKKKKVYTYNARIGSKGGSEFLELGYLRPDYILKDLVKIGHPELLEGYQLYFYKELN